MDELKVHPFAAMFPMMPEAELRELADDIKDHGLRDPIVLDSTGLLIDGRNRLAACKLAGVEPTTMVLPDGEDAEAYIASRNTKRRSLPKGPEAMVFAKAIERRVNLNSQPASLDDVNVAAEARRFHTNKTYLGFALLVLRYAPDLAEQVQDGTIALADAYQEARQRKLAAKQQAAATKIIDRKLGRLQREAPDLYEQVLAETLSLDDALVQFSERVIRKTTIHPYNARFPMLTGDEMHRFVRSVEQMGLLKPIMYDQNGVLIDGKIRLVACALAGVEPKTQVFSSTDPGAIRDWIYHENCVWGTHSYTADDWERVADGFEEELAKGEGADDTDTITETIERMRQRAANMRLEEEWDRGMAAEADDDDDSEQEEVVDNEARRRRSEALTTLVDTLVEARLRQRKPRSQRPHFMVQRRSRVRAVQERTR